LQYAGNDILAMLDKIKGRYSCVHLKDYMITYDSENKTFNPTFAPIGDGQIDFKAVIKKMKENGVQHFLVEQDKASTMQDALSEVERSNFEKMFKSDVKKHIDAICTKYIIKDVTSDQAILFLPAEAIFAEINAYHPDLVEYSQKKRVWLTSPTTLMATLTTIEVLLRNIERDKHAKEIQNELAKLSVEFSRYRSRWDKLSNSIKTVSKEVDEINTTTEKITKKFDSINNVELDLDETKLLD
jgi:DNA anti-recombination protein RmuC